MPIRNTGNYKEIFCRSFAFSRYLYWNLGKLLTFMCSPPNDKYTFHYRVPNTQENVSCVCVFFVSSDVHFFEFRLAEKQLFHISPFHAWSYVLMSLGCLEVSNRVSNWNKGKIHFRCVDISNMPNGNTDIHIQIYCCELYMNLSIIWVLCI